jgi:hypothetical protein
MATARNLLLFSFSLCLATSTFADSSNGTQTVASASGERLASAMGHYARSRSLLISAIHEFDRANKLANPGALLNSEAWRAALIDRAEELEKVLDPQPRSSRSGVKFEGDSRLLGETKR